jgi:hypothetical protein
VIAIGIIERECKMEKYQKALNTLKTYAQDNPKVKWVLIHEGNLIQELVDRATPMKTLKGEGVYRFIDYCPKCKKMVDDNYEEDEHCKYCGQAIDWGIE